MAVQIHTSSAQAVILTVTFLICRTKSWAHSDQGTQQGAGLPDSETQTRSFASSKAWFTHTQARSRITAPSTMGEWLLTRRTGDNCWKQCGPAALELRGRQAELITPRAKPVLGMEHSHATHRYGVIHSQGYKGTSQTLPVRGLFGRVRTAENGPSSS